MPAPTANEIKTQLKTLLTPVIGTALTKKVLIFDYLALAFKSEEGEEVAILRSPLDNDALPLGETEGDSEADGLTESDADALGLTDGEGDTEAEGDTL